MGVAVWKFVDSEWLEGFVRFPRLRLSHSFKSSLPVAWNTCQQTGPLVNGDHATCSLF